jgi:hypothetical protein
MKNPVGSANFQPGDEKQTHSKDTKMQKKSNTEIRDLAGEIYIEAEIMMGAGGETELQHITSVSCMIGGKGKTIYINLNDFRDRTGRRVAEVIEQEAATIEALIDMQDQAEKAEAEATKAEDNFIWSEKWKAI